MVILLTRLSAKQLIKWIQFNYIAMISDFYITLTKVGNHREYYPYAVELLEIDLQDLREKMKKGEPQPADSTIMFFINAFNQIQEAKSKFQDFRESYSKQLDPIISKGFEKQKIMDIEEEIDYYTNILEKINIASVEILSFIILTCPGYRENKKFYDIAKNFKKFSKTIENYINDFEYKKISPFESKPGEERTQTFVALLQFYAGAQINNSNKDAIARRWGFDKKESGASIKQDYDECRDNKFRQGILNLNKESSFRRRLQDLEDIKIIILKTPGNNSNFDKLEEDIQELQDFIKSEGWD